MNKNHGVFLRLGLAVTLVGLLSMSCNNNNNELFERVYWKLYLNPRSQVPAVDRTETALVSMQLLSDNTLIYSIKTTGLHTGDSLTGARMHAGDAITNGPVVLDFEPRFSNGMASGSIALRQSLVDSLMNFNTQLYFNVRSMDYPEGLARGQVHTDVIMAFDVNMEGAKQVPAVETTASGKALIRLTSDYKLFSNVSVMNLESADSLTVAHIRQGAAGENGDLLVPLCDSLADFGKNKVRLLTSNEVYALRTKETYVNAYSTRHSTGLVRGQLVNGLANASAGSR